jgi:hypothetical protein
MLRIANDKVLQEYVEQAYDKARLGRTDDLLERNRVLAEILSELEIAGEAMRFVDTDGRIAWKASPSLRQHLNDLELDAQGDLEDV